MTDAVQETIPAEGAAPDAAPVFDPVRRATELAIIDSLRSVVDPELGMDVVDLGLIREIVIGPESSEIRMVLTTPFCPYAGEMFAQVKDCAEFATGTPVKVTLLVEAWDPREAGLMW